jgi:hypothetical protein
MEPAMNELTGTLEQCVSAIAAVGTPAGFPQRLEVITSARAESGSLSATQVAVLVLIAEKPPALRNADPTGLVDELASQDPLVMAAMRYLGLRFDRGWSAANRRGRAIDSLLSLLTTRLRRLGGITTPLDLLLRGSGGQGIPTIFSDVDFELSGPDHPQGHELVERAIETSLAGLGIDAEGSSGRPTNRDLQGAEGRHRELHEWMELRRAGDSRRDLGWATAPFASLPSDWWRTPSAYELEGRRATPKYAFFEARALVARLAFMNDTGSGTTRTQLWALRHLGLDDPVMQLEHAITTCLELYEHPDSLGGNRLNTTQASLQKLRERFSLPGPDLSRDPTPDTRRSSQPLAEGPR